MFRVGANIIHALHGLGVVEAIEEKVILGNVTRFAVLKFDRLQILANVDQKNSMIHAPIDSKEVPAVLTFLANCDAEPPFNYTRRDNINLEKVKSGDLNQVCEVIKSLSKLGRGKKLTYKDQSMLERARNVLAQELGFATNTEVEEMEQLIDQACTKDAEKELQPA